MEYTKETEALIRPLIERINLQDKIRDAINDMMAKVSIDESHNYTRLSDGKWLAGTTSVSGIYPKDWLAAWGEKEAVKDLGYSDFPGDTKEAEKMLEKIRNLASDEKKTDVERYLAILKEAKGASFRKSKEALLDGKEGHEWIEAYIKAKIRFEILPQLPEGKLDRPLKQFVEWAEKEVDYWILSEARVCDVEKEYAGTLDAVAKMRSGDLALIDAKFASHISEEYSLQTAGYAATFEKYDIKFDKRIIVRLPKTLEKQEWDKKSHIYSMIENTIEVREIDSPYEFDRDSFYSALKVSKWINYMKRKENKPSEVIKNIE